MPFLLDFAHHQPDPGPDGELRKIAVDDLGGQACAFRCLDNADCERDLQFKRLCRNVDNGITQNFSFPRQIPGGKSFSPAFGTDAAWRKNNFSAAGAFGCLEPETLGDLPRISWYDHDRPSNI